MNILAQLIAILLIFGGAWTSALIPLSMSVSLGVGVLFSALGGWMIGKWPAPKPVYIAATSRPAPLTSRGQRLIVLITGVLMVLMGLFLIILMPTLVRTSFVARLPFAGSYLIGVSLGYIVSGWMNAPYEVERHNKWLSAMNPMR